MLEDLQKLIGKTVKLYPFPEREGHFHGMYYNYSMSDSIKKDPHVKVLSIEERRCGWYEMCCKFADGRNRWIVYEWIDFSEEFALFI